MHNLDEIKHARLKKGLTQENMADELGMSQSNYHNIENGKQKKEPKPALLGKIATIVGIGHPPGFVPSPPAPGQKDEDALRKELERLQQKVDNIETELSLFKKLWNHFFNSGGGAGR